MCKKINLNEEELMKEDFRERLKSKNVPMFQKFSDMSEEEIVMLEEVGDIEATNISAEASSVKMSKKRAAIEFYLAKTIEKSTKDIIESNRELAESNDTHNKSIRIISMAMVFLGIVQILVSVIGLFIRQN